MPQNSPPARASVSWVGVFLGLCLVWDTCKGSGTPVEIRISAHHWDYRQQKLESVFVSLLDTIVSFPFGGPRPVIN